MTIMRDFRIVLLLFLAASLAAVLVLFTHYSAKATTDHTIGVAAVVNDDIISTLDVEERIRLVIASTGLSDSPEVRERLRLQIIRQLVDETLQLQEAKRYSISVSEGELKQAIADIERRSNKPPGSFERHMQATGIPKRSFLEQIRAQISWSKLVVSRVRPKVRVSDQEVSLAKARRSAGVAEQQLEISAILLPVDVPKNEENIRKLADRLVGEIRGGASFNAVATQFATGQGQPPASRFWVQASQMEPQIAEKVLKLAKGDITDPIRTISGYHIVKLFDMRTQENPIQVINKTEVALKQIVLSLKPEAELAEVELMLGIAQMVRENPGSCLDPGVAGFKDIDDVEIDVSFSRGLIDDLPIQVRGMVESLKVSELTEPFATPKGIQLFMLCERIEMPVKEAPDEGIREALYREKLELEASKYIRNLRRDAFIEVRK